MITAIELENFKAFGDPQRLEIRPITLLYGRNSSGKSSCIRALQMLQQTARSARTLDELVLTGPRAEADFGSYEEVVYGHDRNRHARIGLWSTSDVLSHASVHLDLGLSPDSTDSTSAYVLGVAARAKTRGGATVELGRLEGQETRKAEVEDEIAAADDERGEDSGRSFVALPIPEELYEDVGRQARERLEHILASLSARDESDFRLVRLRFPHRGKGFDLRLMPSTADLADFPFTAEVGKKSDREEVIRLLKACLATDLRGLFKEVTESLQSEEAGRPRGMYRGRPDGSILGDTMQRRVRFGSLRDAEHLMAERLVGDEESPTAAVRRAAHLIACELDRYFLALGSAAYAALGGVSSDLETLVTVPALRPAPARILAYEDEHAVIAADCEVVSNFLGGFGIHRELRPETLTTGDGRVVGYELRLRDRSDDVDRGESWADVGFGVSQVMPMIRECARARGLVCVEQPELHLHPAAQAYLADFFVAMVKGPPRGRRPARAPWVRSRYRGHRRFIVETHSEHLVLRVKQLLREGKIGPEDVSLNVIEREEGGSRIRRISMDDRGRFLDQWPGGFFAEREELL